MRRLQHSQRLRRIHGQQRTRSQVTEKEGHPQAADAGEGGKQGPTDVECVVMQRLCWLDVPEDVDDSQQKQERRDPDQSTALLFRPLREQKGERDGEMEFYQGHVDISPTAV